jgi:hypothetical protein
MKCLNRSRSPAARPSRPRLGGDLISHLGVPLAGQPTDLRHPVEVGVVGLRDRLDADVRG